MPRLNRLFRTLAPGIILGSSAFAAQLIPSGYSYNLSPAGGYPDSGSELTDGITFSRAWDGVSGIGPEDVVNLVGWQFSSPTITFTFASPVTIRSVAAYFADSNGAAGVGMPSSVGLSDGGAFSRSFPVVDPDGAGSTLETLFSGFEVTTDTLQFSFSPGYQWTMLSEVQFFSDAPAAVPEPASCATAAGAISLGLLAWRRRKA